MNIIKKVLYFFKRLRTRTIFLLCIFAGFSCFVLISIAAPRPADPFNGLLVTLAFIFWGVSGIPMIMRHEADFGLIIFEGPLAVIIGVLITLLGFSLSLIPIIVLIHQ